MNHDACKPYRAFVVCLHLNINDKSNVRNYSTVKSKPKGWVWKYLLLRPLL